MKALLDFHLYTPPQPQPQPLPLISSPLMAATLASQLEEAVFICTEPSKHPTREQVWKLAQLAKSSEEALEIIQEKLFFRLTHPHQSHVREVEHTLVVIQQCSYIASLAFVNYFKERIYAIAALMTFRSTAALASDVKAVNHRARKLFELLRSDAKLQEERDKAYVPWSSGGRLFAGGNGGGSVGGGGDAVENHPARSQHSFSPPGRMATTPGGGGGGGGGPGRREVPQTRAVPQVQAQNMGTASSSLPTPQSSPVQQLYEVKPDEEARSDHGSDDHNVDSRSDAGTLDDLSVEERVEEAVLAATANTPTEITREQMDMIASSTFDSYTLQIVVSVLLERLFAVTGQRTYHHLTKVLKLINHCLRQGSPTFFSWFKEHRGLVGTLCTSPAVTAVNRLATAILNSLDEENSTREPIPSQLRRPHIQATPPPPSESNPYPLTPLSPTSNIDITDMGFIPFHEPVKDLTAFITTISNSPFARGGSSLVYKAKLSVGASTEIVVKKVLMSQGGGHTQLEKSVNCEIHVWTGFRHQNVAIFYGITREDDGAIGLISPYFKHGNIVDYIKSMDKSKVNVLKLMNDITAGVSYLHRECFVHGDIKGSNIMIDDAGNAKLIDFGISRITGEHGYTTSGSGASWAWAAPELVPYDGRTVPKTLYSDIWALAITFVELMTGRPPYGGLRLGGILAKYQQRAYPERPAIKEECFLYPEDRLWALLLCCWDYTPEHRPTIETIRGTLAELADVS